MKKIVMILSAVAGLAAFTPKAVEAANQGFYVGALGGVNFLQTSKGGHHHRHDGDGDGERGRGGRREIEFDVGYDVGGFIGYEFCSGLAVEAEFTYRHNDISKIKFCGEHFKSRGHFESMSYMANVIYEINLSRCWCMPITPYIGGGVGYAQQRLKLGHCFGEGKKNGFAWQVIAGIGYDFSRCFDIALDYRFNKGRAERIYNHSLSLAFAYHF